MDIGELIRERRSQNGVTQLSLARRAGTTQAAISRIERGLTTPTWDTVEALLISLGYEPELGTRRLSGRWNPLHLAAMRKRTPTERLRLAVSSNRLAGRLRQAGREARDEH